MFIVAWQEFKAIVPSGNATFGLIDQALFEVRATHEGKEKRQEIRAKQTMFS